MRTRSVPVDVQTRATLPRARMSDAYRLVVNEQTLDAATASCRMFGRVPWWIRGLMMVRNLAVAPFGLKTGRDRKVSASRRIGFFPVLAETPERVVLGLDDKHVDFRVTVDVVALGNGQQQVTATTLVRTHNLLGRIHLAAALPFHRVIVPAMLTQAGKKLPHVPQPARIS